jgi:hypothetical protein
MKTYHACLIYILLFAFLFSAGCSNGHNPVSPEITPDNESTTPAISSADELSGIEQYRGVFGAWSVHVDIPSMTAELVPARNASKIGDIFDADLLQFLTVSPCFNCMRIAGMSIDSVREIDQYRINLRVQMKHPFADLSKRPDLHGFDVRAIFIFEPHLERNFEGIQVMDSAGIETNSDFGDPRFGLLNFDGYTSHFDNIVNDERYFPTGSAVAGNLNPFMRFFENYGTGTFDPAAPTGHNVIATGAGWYERTAVFDLTAGETGIDFYIVADVSYGQSAVLANRKNPQYYLPSFNRTEPWRIEYWTENNTLEYNNTSSSAEIVVQVFDWQQGATVDPLYPNPSNLSGIAQSSDVLRVELHVPDLTDIPLTVTVPEQGDGSPTNPLQYRFLIVNENNHYDDAIGLLAIRDELYGQAAPNGRIPIPDSPAGFPYSTQDIRDYTLYYPIFINFASKWPWDMDWFAKIDNELYQVPEEQFASTDGMGGADTQLHPFYYSDMAGKKYQYSWDYDYDGSTFDIDGGGLPSENIHLDRGGLHNVGLKVRTNSVPVNETIFTIPVYGEGIGFDNTPLDPGLTNTSTSLIGNNSCVLTKDKFYVVETREIDGQRDIWLTMTDRQGVSSSFQVTDTSGASQDPAMCLIEEGANAGIYVVYPEYNGVFMPLWFTKGNLDGTGFTPPVRISASTNNEYSANIIFFESQLIVYYVNVNASWLLYAAHSTNFGIDWFVDGSIANNGSTYQNELSVEIAKNGADVAFAYAETLDYANRGYDIYWATSTDGLSFSTPENISIFDGKVHESAISTSYNYEMMTIAYLANVDGSPKSNARVKIIHYYTHSIADYRIQSGIDQYSDDYTHIKPCISAIIPGLFTFAVGSLDLSTKELTLYVLDLEGSGYPGRLWEYEIMHKSLGTAAGSLSWRCWINPCLKSYSPVCSVTENFLAFRNFNSGYTNSVVAPVMLFGDLETIYFVSRANQDQ